MVLRDYNSAELVPVWPMAHLRIMNLVPTYVNLTSIYCVFLRSLLVKMQAFRNRNVLTQMQIFDQPVVTQYEINPTQETLYLLYCKPTKCNIRRC